MNLAEHLILSQEAALKEKLMSGLRLVAGVDWELIKVRIFQPGFFAL